MSHMGASLARRPARLLLQSPKSMCNSLGRRCRACETSPSAEDRIGIMFQACRRNLCRGLWPAAVCDLCAASRPAGGRGLKFPWDLGGSPCASVWGAEMRGAHWRLLCAAVAMPEGGGPADGEAHASTHMSEGSSQPQAAGRIFQDTCHMLQGPEERKVSMTA